MEWHRVAPPRTRLMGSRDRGAHDAGSVRQPCRCIKIAGLRIGSGTHNRFRGSGMSPLFKSSGSSPFLHKHLNRMVLAIFFDAAISNR